MADIENSTQTQVLLERLHGGDRSAVTELLRLHLGWVEGRIRGHLNERLRRRGDTQDYVNELVVRVLTRRTPFVINDADHFRRIILRMVNNLLTDSGRRVDAQRREVARERRLPSRISVLYLNDPPALRREGVRPVDEVVIEEETAYLRLALDLLDPSDRHLIEMREEENMSYARVGQDLGISEDAARKRFSYALRRLGRVVKLLQCGQVDRALVATGAERD